MKRPGSRLVRIDSAELAAVEDERLALAAGQELDDVTDDQVVIAGGHHVVDVAVELGERFADGIEPVRRSPYVVVREIAAAVGKVECHLPLPAMEDRDGEPAGLADDAQRAGVVRERRRVRAADRARPR